MPKILLGNDDPTSCEALANFLSNRGHVVARSSVDEVVDVVDTEDPCAVIVARVTTDEDTRALCRVLHDRGGVRVLFLAERADVADRIAAYEAGADDVMVGASSFEEVDARLRAMLRRSRVARPPEIIAVGDLRIDRARHRVSRSGEEIPLTLTEFNLLEYFAKRKNVAVTRKEVLEAVWGGGIDGFTNIVDVYVNYLRKKIERGDRPKLLKTVRGVGYMVEEPGLMDAELGAAL